MSTAAARHVLVVEDDLSVRRPLVKFLEMHGFSVATADAAADGVAALGAQSFVAAVVNLRLRQGNGQEVVMAAPPRMPVIIFSGASAELEGERARPHTHVIEKPYSLVLLVEALEAMIETVASENLHS